jgi:REP element-mobilizing transposase RayT
MAAHVFHEIYLHLTWHTKDDVPLITAELEPLVHEVLTGRCHQTKGVYLHAINGTSTHVHLAINVEPSIAVSELIGELKGYSSHEVNKQQRMKRLEWQRGFGVVSFGKKKFGLGSGLHCTTERASCRGSARGAARAGII